MKNDIDDVWKQGIESLERITVRGSFTHGHSTLRGDIDYPLVCIGDSLRNCGLGGGGILAMQDAVEISKLIINNDHSLVSFQEAMEKMLERKNDHMIERKERLNGLMFKRLPERSCDFTWNDLKESSTPAQYWLTLEYLRPL